MSNNGGMVPGLRNRATNVTHLATEHGEPWCGARVDRRLIPFQVRRPDEVNCDRCRRSQAFKSHAYAQEIGFEEADAIGTIVKPPRMLPPS